MKQQKKLKPVVTNSVRHKHNAPQHGEQIILLKAMEVTQDPKKLKQMMGVKTVAEVYRTLDKMAIRKEYHEALARVGFTPDKVVQGIYDIATTAEKDDTRLKAYQAIMKSIGLDKYESADTPNGGTWEEELLKSIENDKKQVEQLEPPKYEVVVPEIPEEVKKAREEEEGLTESIYGS